MRQSVVHDGNTVINTCDTCRHHQGCTQVIRVDGYMAVAISSTVRVLSQRQKRIVGADHLADEVMKVFRYDA